MLCKSGEFKAKCDPKSKVKLWALLRKFSENFCQKNNYNLTTRKDLGKPTVLPKSTLNFVYIHIKTAFLKNLNFLLKSDGLVPP